MRHINLNNKIMNLRKFGKLMKKRFGSVGGELLQKLHDFYTEDVVNFQCSLPYLVL